MNQKYASTGWEKCPDAWPRWFDGTPLHPALVDVQSVPRDCFARNRGADFVQRLAPPRFAFFDTKAEEIDVMTLWCYAERRYIGR